MLFMRITQILCAALAMVLLPGAAFVFVMLQSPPTVDVDVELTNKDALSFLLLGDQGTGNLRQWQVAAGMKAEMLRSPADGVFLMGDSFYRHGVDSVHDWQWRYKFENVYDESLAEIPFFATFGNHDYYGSETALLEYARRNIGSGRWQLPARDYLKVFGGSSDEALMRVAVIDTGLIIRDTDNAVQHLDRLLSDAPSALWTVVVTHKPLSSANQLDHQTGAKELWLPVLKRHGVSLIVSGHDHNMQLLAPTDAPLQVIQGAGGKYGQPLDYPDAGDLEFYSKRQGFGRLEVNADHMLVQFYDHEAELLHEHRLTVSHVTE